MRQFNGLQAVATVLLAVPFAGFSQTSNPVMIQLSSETAPPGGLAQIKARTYSPQPVSTGYARLRMASFSIRGIALFSGTGDVVGTAVVSGSDASLQFTSPNGTFGIGNYPLLAVSATIPPNATPGQQFAVAPDPASWTMDVQGSFTPVQINPGSITVGGSVSITDVVPGGGRLPAGATFSILGTGFTPNTQISLQGLSAASIVYVSPGQIQVTLRDSAVLDGTQIHAVNPDNSSDTYFSYMRGVPVGQSSNLLLAQTLPIFSTNAGTEGTLLPGSQQGNSAEFTAFALQNPSQMQATILIEAATAAGSITARANLTLAPGARISREIVEFLGSSLPNGGHLHVLSSQPVQMLGMRGNDQTGVVVPIAFSLLPTVITDIQVVGAAQNGGPPVGYSDNLTWQIKDNQSAMPAPGVVFTSTLPDSFHINSVTATQGSCSVAAQTIVCTLGQIKGGATAVVSVNATPVQRGIFSTSGAATFSGSDTNPANNSFTVTMNAQ